MKVTITCCILTTHPEVSICQQNVLVGEYSTMAKSQRNSQEHSGRVPGPGSYELSRSFNNSIPSSKSKCKIGKDKRNINFAANQKTPGPGSYNKKSFIQINKLKEQGFSCRSNHQQKSPLHNTPGPGQYQTPLHILKSAPIIKMTKSLRHSFTDQNIRTHEFIPGPGSFDVQGQDRMKFRSMSVHRFSKSKNNYLSDSINSQSSKKVSPAIYNANSFLLKRSSPKFSISQNPHRGLFEKIEKIPGPGQYDPKISLLLESQKSFKLPISQRPNTIKHLLKLPGPGQYSSPKNNRLGTLFKFNKQRRQQLFLQKYSSPSCKFQPKQSWQARQQFPNPPKYMDVIPKLQYKPKAPINPKPTQSQK